MSLMEVSDGFVMVVGHAKFHNGPVDFGPKKPVVDRN